MAVKRVGSCIRCGKCCNLIGFFVPNTIGFDEWAMARGLSVEYRDNCESAMVTLDYPCPQLEMKSGLFGCRLQGKDKPECCNDWPFGPECLLPGCGFSFEEEVS